MTRRFLIHGCRVRVRARVLAVAALTALAAGCTLGPDFSAPVEQAPETWKASGAAESSPLPERWWTLFSDAELSQLVEQALLRNQDLQAGLARVEQARAAAGIARAAQLPYVAIDPSAERERFSAHREVPPVTTHDARAAYTANDFEVPLDVAWEVDLWGRLRRAREAADAAAQASEYDYSALSLAISSEVARTYFALRSARREEDVLSQGADLRQHALDLLEGRARAGIGNDLDTSRARSELATVQAELHGVARGRAALEDALAVLCGEAPADFTATNSSAELNALPSIPAGLPSELLRRRPTSRPRSSACTKPARTSAWPRRRPTRSFRSRARPVS